MSFAGLLVHDVTIVTPASDTDRYGNTVKDWATATRSVVKGWVSQQSRSEVLGQREAGIADWIAFFLPEVVIVQFDRVEWEGITFEVDGPPNPAWTPRGEHHQEVPLHVVAG